MSAIDGQRPPLRTPVRPSALPHTWCAKAPWRSRGAREGDGSRRSRRRHPARKWRRGPGGHGAPGLPRHALAGWRGHTGRRYPGRKDARRRHAWRSCNAHAGCVQCQCERLGVEVQDHALTASLGGLGPLQHPVDSLQPFRGLQTCNITLW